MACCGQGQRKAGKTSRSKAQSNSMGIAQKISRQVSAQNSQSGQTSKNQPFNPFFHKFNRFLNM